MAKRVLHQRKKAPTSKTELLGLVILQVLCAAYKEAPTIVVTKQRVSTFFKCAYRLSGTTTYEMLSAAPKSAELLMTTAVSVGHALQTGQLQ